MWWGGGGRGGGEEEKERNPMTLSKADNELTPYMTFHL